eukprot:g2665.t1
MQDYYRTLNDASIVARYASNAAQAASNRALQYLGRARHELAQQEEEHRDLHIAAAAFVALSACRSALDRTAKMFRDITDIAKMPPPPPRPPKVKMSSSIAKRQVATVPLAKPSAISELTEPKVAASVRTVRSSSPRPPSYQLSTAITYHASIADGFVVSTRTAIDELVVLKSVVATQATSVPCVLLNSRNQSQRHDHHFVDEMSPAICAYMTASIDVRQMGSMSPYILHRIIPADKRRCRQHAKAACSKKSTSVQRRQTDAKKPMNRVDTTSTTVQAKTVDAPKEIDEVVAQPSIRVSDADKTFLKRLIGREGTAASAGKDESTKNAKEWDWTQHYEALCTNIPPHALAWCMHYACKLTQCEYFTSMSCPVIRSKEAGDTVSMDPCPAKYVCSYCLDIPQTQVFGCFDGFHFGG